MSLQQQWLGVALGLCAVGCNAADLGTTVGSSQQSLNPANAPLSGDHSNVAMTAPNRPAVFHFYPGSVWSFGVEFIDGCTVVSGSNDGFNTMAVLQNCTDLTVLSHQLTSVSKTKFYNQAAVGSAYPHLENAIATWKNTITVVDADMTADASHLSYSADDSANPVSTFNFDIQRSAPPANRITNFMHGATLPVPPAAVLSATDYATLNLLYQAAVTDGDFPAYTFPHQTS